MAGDSSKEDQAAQSAHADGMKFRRQLTRNLGITTNQARRILQAFSKEIRDSRQPDGPAVQKAPTGDPFPQANITTDEQGFHHAGSNMTVGDDKGGTKTTTPSGVVLKDVVALDFSDDIFYYHNFYETGRKDAV